MRQVHVLLVLLRHAEIPDPAAGVRDIAGREGEVQGHRKAQVRRQPQEAETAEGPDSEGTNSH